MLGVFLLPIFTHLGHECQDLLSPWDGMHMCTDKTAIYTLIQKSFGGGGGGGVRTHVIFKGNHGDKPHVTCRLLSVLSFFKLTSNLSNCLSTEVLDLHAGLHAWISGCSFLLIPVWVLQQTSGWLQTTHSYGLCKS